MSRTDAGPATSPGARVVAVALASAALTVASLLAQAPSATAAPALVSGGRPIMRYVALGDSYSSGEANPPFVTSKNDCDLSRHRAWPELLAAAERTRVALVGELACAGASIKALEAPFKGQPAQIPAMARLDPGLVTITIGGNDIGFSGIVANCFLLNCARDGELRLASARVRRLIPALVEAYRDIRSHTRAGTDILAVGYPRLLPLHAADRRACPWLASDEQRGLNRLARELNDAVRRAARRAGVRFVSTLAALTGHELCSRQPWVWAVGRLPVKFDAHPTLHGQEAMARIVRAAVAATRRRG